MMKTEALSNIISHIENQEAKLLNWGITNGVFTANEIAHIISQASTPNQLTDDQVNSIISDLVSSNYLFEIPKEAYQGEVRYRSRMAEGVRLLTRLKQLFHKNMTEPYLWRAAKSLVGDYRLILRPRSYPKRDIKWNNLKNAIKNLSEVQLALLEKLFSNDFKLSKFQFESTKHIYIKTNEKDRKENGTIVCAGTGCGKTLAFYLPALLTLVDLASEDRWTRAIAIYPRNELLKDQLASAIRQILTLNKVLLDHGMSTVQIGVLYSDVPTKLEDISGCVRYGKKQEAKWEKKSNGRYICPYLVCPQCIKHQSAMLWDPKKPTQLSCDSEKCSFVLPDDVFPISRESMRQNPPDLLFTSIEIFNQQLSNTSSHTLLGKNENDKRPRLVLLDEVHTYYSTYGAQVALMLRRWRTMFDITAHYVGLSATLEDASRFFSDLIGIKENQVEELSPQSGDLEVAGQEILLALKGDPSSGASLLSTSIQASMLMRRILEPFSSVPSQIQRTSLYGSKVFTFTDDLDATNRLFEDLFDAEQNKKLVSLRRSLKRLNRGSNDQEQFDFFHEGQRWTIAEKLKHDLTQGAKVSRTSSQDPGVNPNAEIIIATAALEVGFDDDQVGAVIQHKAPKDAASFLQRKGRAGRTRGTHPWMVVVLSDYGRDRVCYQSYEQLFSPILKPYHLPLQNLYILKMQGVYMLLDWLSNRLNFNQSIWHSLSAPLMNKKLRQSMIRHLEELSKSSSHMHNNFKTYVKKVIFGKDIFYSDSDEQMEQDNLIQQILWSRPRGLMIEVIPTALRRLKTQWKTINGTQEPYKANSPLPEFIPDMLFSELNLPEVEIHIPQQIKTLTKNISKPILRAMSELAPGRVTKGLNSSHNQEYWIPIKDQVITGNQNTIEIEDFTNPMTWDQYGEKYFVQINKSVERYRPRQMKVYHTPSGIQKSSNSQHIWIWDFTSPVATSSSLRSLPRYTPWRKLIDTIEIFTHVGGNPVTAHRYSIGVRYEVKKNYDRYQGEAYFVHKGRRASLGFEIDVDAIRIQLKVPQDLIQNITGSSLVLRALRRDYFAYCIHSDRDIPYEVNTFDRDHLIQGTLSTLIWYAINQKCSLEQAGIHVFDNNLSLIKLVSDQLVSMTLDSQDPTEKTRRIQDLLNCKKIQNTLRTHSKVLWQSSEEIAWKNWLLDRYRSTIGIAFLETSQQICTDIDLNDLYLDLPPLQDTTSDTISLWISERHPGGNGIIEKIESSYINDPRSFWRHATSVLDQGDFEIIDQSLQRTLDLLNNPANTHLAQLAHEAREAVNHGIESTQKSYQKLMPALSAQGVILTRPVMISMQNRIFRAGSNRHTDRVLAHIVTQWNESETRLGIEIDPQIIAYSFKTDAIVQQVFSTPLQSAEMADKWRYSVLYSLLWPRGSHVRQQSLSTYNPYQNIMPGDRLIISLFLEETVRSLTVDSQPINDIIQQIIRILTEHGQLELKVPNDLHARFTLILTQIIANPVDIGILLVYPHVVGVRRCTDYTKFQIELRETTI